MKFDPTKVTIGLVRDMDDAHKIIEWAKTVPDQLIGLDVETDGLDWYDGRLRLVQFGTLNDGWAVPFEDNKMLVREVLRILSDRDKFFVGHNFKFDLHFLDRHAEWLPKEWRFAHDTMLMAAVLNSSGAKGLKDLAEHYVWADAKSGQTQLKEDMKNGGWDWGTVPVTLPSYWAYGVLDTILTVNLFYALHFRCEQAGVMDAYETERGATPALFAIEKNGMLLDAEHAREERDGWRANCLLIENAVLEYGIDNINSGPQLALAFINAGIELTKRTPSGKSWAMDRDTFDLIAATNDHPLVNLIKQHRVGTKYASTYYDNFLKFQRSDGRCHPFYRPVVAKTGRMSADGPAILTVPRPGTDPEVRNSFVAPDGHVLISTDFSNVEARVFAHFAQEHGMIQAFKDGVDLHCYTAKEIFNLDFMPSKHDPRRQTAKNTLFCTLFGGGAQKIAVTAGISLEEGERSQRGLYTAFPGIKAFQRRSIEIATDNLNAHGQAFVRGIDGRILAMVETDDRYYAFTNWQIQSAANVILKQRLAVLDAMGLSQYLVAAIHDEVVAEIPEEFEEDYKVMVKEGMEDYYSFDVPVVAETGDGAVRWGDAK
jgi:DNA polymerase I